MYEEIDEVGNVVEVECGHGDEAHCEDCGGCVECSNCYCDEAEDFDEY